MQTKVKNVAGIIIISMEGDFISEPEQIKFRERIRELVEEGKTNFVVDLSLVKHINSCGLGSLVCALTKARRSGGDIRLAGLGSNVEELFKLTQLIMIFKISPTVEDAVAQYHTH
jgi:anti-sigma B factor antagonist